MKTYKITVVKNLTGSYSEYHSEFFEAVEEVSELRGEFEGIQEALDYLKKDDFKGYEPIAIEELRY